MSTTWRPMDNVASNTNPDNSISSIWAYGHENSTNAHSATDQNTPERIVLRDSNGDFSAHKIYGDLVGNADSATVAESIAGTPGGVTTSGGWFNTTGDTGWQNSDYGGGIYMTDLTYVRTYNNKAFLASYFKSTVATGTPPLVVDSTTKVDNLNADFLDDHDSSYFTPINNPIFSGTPTVPTAPNGTNTTQIATTEFVLNNNSNTTITEW